MANPTNRLDTVPSPSIASNQPISADKLRAERKADCERTQIAAEQAREGLLAAQKVKAAADKAHKQALEAYFRIG